MQKLLAGVCGLFLLWMGGLVWFAETMPEKSEIPEETTDGIVVLTGGSERINTGILLLAQSKGKKLLISGVYRGVDVEKLLRLDKQVPYALECCIVLGYGAESTVGNAIEAADWAQKEGFVSLRLVTASYHMRRSLLEFKHATQGAVKLVAHPVFPEHVKQEHWWRYPGTSGLFVSEYNKYLIALVRYYLFSKASLEVGGK